MSQLKGRSYVSFYELILSSSIFEEIESCRVFLFFCRRARWRPQRQRCQDQHDAMTQYPREEQMDREDCDSVVSPLPLSDYAWISGRDSCLVGVSCHSPSLPCLPLHFMHAFKLHWIWKWKWSSQMSWNWQKGNKNITLKGNQKNVPNIWENSDSE